ncbi:hypothetical protein ABIB26_003408 [Arthrobacter sp. UYEF20]
MAPTNPSDAEDPAEGTAPGTARAFGSEPPQGTCTARV